MKKIILILMFLIFITACAEQTEEKPSESVAKESADETTVIEQAKTSAQEEAAPESIPSSYKIEGVPYYGETGFCYGGSAMMLLMHNGFTQEQAMQYRTTVKTGKGGPPDIFIGFKEYDVIGNIHIGYSKNFIKEYADFYNNNLLENPDEQTMLFAGESEAFTYMKKLISSNKPVIVIVHNGNHYVVAIGYDDEYVYTNDPGWDNAYNYKIDSDPNLKQRRIPVNIFLDEWSIKGFEGGGIGFPGDYGMIWFEKKP